MNRMVFAELIRSARPYLTDESDPRYAALQKAVAAAAKELDRHRHLMSPDEFRELQISYCVSSRPDDNEEWISWSELYTDIPTVRSSSREEAVSKLVESIEAY